MEKKGTDWACEVLGAAITALLTGGGRSNPGKGTSRGGGGSSSSGNSSGTTSSVPEMAAARSRPAFEALNEATELAAAGLAAAALAAAVAATAGHWQQPPVWLLPRHRTFPSCMDTVPLN